MQAVDYMSDSAVMFIEVGNSQATMMEKYAFIPMTWIEFEFGGSGVCCITALDLNQQQSKITRIAS